MEQLITCFDAPSLHTMYVDKPMHSHGLMQAIARVNRVFKDKPGGDYTKFFTGSPREKMSLIPAAMDFIVKQERSVMKWVFFRLFDHVLLKPR